MGTWKLSQRRFLTSEGRFKLMDLFVLIIMSPEELRITGSRHPQFDFLLTTPTIILNINTTFLDQAYFPWSHARRQCLFLLVAKIHSVHRLTGWRFTGFVLRFVLYRARVGLSQGCCSWMYVMYYFRFSCAWHIFSFSFSLLPYAYSFSFSSHCHSGHSALWVDQWIDQHIVWTLRNLAVDGGDPGRHAVCVWLTAENVDILQKLQEVTWEYNWMAKDVREFTSEVLQEQTD